MEGLRNLGGFSQNNLGKLDLICLFCEVEIMIDVQAETERSGL